jgi:hypothetical protein
MTLNLKSVFINSLIYFAGIFVIFLAYIVFHNSLGHLWDAVERVLYVRPDLIPTPFALAFVILPAVVWNYWERGESAQAFFYVALFLLAVYLAAVWWWLMRLAPLWFTLCFAVAALGDVFVGQHFEQNRWVRTLGVYLVAGPVVYWIIMANF